MTIAAPYFALDGDPKKINWWLEPRGCGNCNHCGMDMTMDPYCAHPTVVKIHRHGLNISVAVRKFCGNPHTLWQKRKP